MILLLLINAAFSSSFVYKNISLASPHKNIEKFPLEEVLPSTVTVVLVAFNRQVQSLETV